MASAPTLPPPATSSFSIGETTASALQSNGDSERMYRQNLCLYGNKLHTIITVSGAQLFYRHSWLDLSNLAKKEPTSGWPGAAPTGTDLIDTSQLSGAKWQYEDIFNTSSFNPTQQSVGLAANADSMYAAYADPSEDGTMVSRRYGPTSDSPSPAWQPGLWMYDTSGRPIFASDGGACLSFYGPDQLLVGLSGLIPDRSFRIYLFDLMDRDETKFHWQARGQQIVQFDDFPYWFNGQRVTVDTQSTGNDLAIDWFAVPPATGETAPSIHLAINVTPGGVSVNGSPGDYSFTTTAELIIDSSTGKIDSGNFQLINAQPFYLRGGGSETGMKRDPAGRLRTFVGPIQGENSPFANSIGSTFFNTGTLPDTSNGMNAVNFPNKAYATSNQVVKPFGEFLIFEQGATTTATGAVSYTDIPVLEFVIYGDGFFQVGHYGTIRTLQFTNTLVPATPDRYVIAGLIDGPIPFPLQNYDNQDLKGTEGRGIASFIYGSESEHETETSTETDWKFGVEASLKFGEGLGPALKASLESGMGSVQANSVSTQLDRSLSVGATVVYNPDGPAPKIITSGAVSTVDAALSITAYQFYDSDNVLVNDSATSNPSCGPKLGAALMSMQGNANRSSINFIPYAGVPGDLTSYTPEAIDTRMKPFFSGDSYFREVICANAYPFAQDKPFLEFTWDGTTRAYDGFQAFNSAFTEQSWTFDASLYAGVSGGVGFSLCGLGEKMEFEALAGFSYSHDRKVDTTVGNGWGIEIEGADGRDWGPPPSADETAVAGYSFRAYFLPLPAAPSTLPSATFWLDELSKHLPAGSELTQANIDANSGCWRVAFAVTQISWVKPSPDRVDYSYDDSKDPPSVYPPPTGSR